MKNTFKIIAISIAVVMLLIIGYAVFIWLSGYIGIPLGDMKISSILKRNEVPVEWVNASENGELPEADPHRLRVIYSIENDSISGIYLEVLNETKKTVSFFEVPGSTKIELSDDLYKELLTYAPTLPKYVKLSKLPGYFSESFRYKGMTKVIAEAVEEKIETIAVFDEKTFEQWKNKGDQAKAKENTEEFYDLFELCARSDLSGSSYAGNMMYFELYSGCEFLETKVIPGVWEKTDYYISGVSAREAVEGVRY